MQYIRTKWLGPTNFRGSRIKVTSSGGVTPLTVAWNYECGVSENHRRAALALAKRLEWAGEWVGGEDAEGYVYVNVDWRDPAFTVGEPRTTEGRLRALAAQMLAYEAQAFDRDEAVNGGDLVEAFSSWRTELRKILA